MEEKMRRHEPSSTLRPPRLTRRSGMSETLSEYVDWRDEAESRIDALVVARHRAFAARFLGSAS